MRVGSWYDIRSRHAVQRLLISYSHVSGLVASRVLGLAKSRTLLCAVFMAAGVKSFIGGRA